MRIRNVKNYNSIVVDFVISGRDENADIIKTAFKNSNAFTKIFGLGLYYPRFNFIYVELDLLEILYLNVFVFRNNYYQYSKYLYLNL